MVQGRERPVRQGFLQRRQPAPHQHQLGAAIPEEARGGSSDAAAGAGHEDPLALQAAQQDSGIRRLPVPERAGTTTPPLTTQVRAWSALRSTAFTRAASIITT